ncbi:hypothetical protein [Rahnella inusitata]|uniref:tail fiber/spike domain-containing protein n=1 Tax=Rahnella inusitata TaxID=58169 RepID=UPI0039BDC077
MATTPTQLPVPSEKPQDLKFNAGKIDEFVTSMGWTYTDRFGVKHYTIEGLKHIAEEAISAFGYITIDSFEDGASLTLPNQVLRWKNNGEYYRWDGVFPPSGKFVPSGSTPEGTGGISKGAWISVGDAALRSNLFSDDINLGDAIISVKQPFNGSIHETQHSQNAKKIDLISAGAKGDEITNDTESINKIEAQSVYSVVDGLGKTYVVDAYPTNKKYINTTFLIGGETKRGNGFFDGATRGTNVIVGDGAGKKLPANPTSSNGTANIAIGEDAMKNGIDIRSSIAIGLRAMHEAIVGKYNIALGLESLYYVDADGSAFGGTRNVMLGDNTGRFISTGYQNVGAGRNAMQCITTGNNNLGLGTNAFAGRGSLKFKDSQFIQNQTPITVSNSTGVGSNALYFGGGINSTAVGSGALANTKSDASNCTATGKDALIGLGVKTSQSGMVAVQDGRFGSYSMTATSITFTLPSHGLSSGWNVIVSLTTGVPYLDYQYYSINVVDANTFTVSEPLGIPTTGSFTLIEYSTNVSQATGASNSAYGSGAMYGVNVGTENAAFGVNTNAVNNAGNQNAAFGNLALRYAVSSSQNSAFGYGALRQMQDGSQATSLTNCTGIGFGAFVSGNNQMQLGNSLVSVYAYSALQIRSDERDKADKHKIDGDIAVAFIRGLDSYFYKYDYRDDYIEEYDVQICIDTEAQPVFETRIRHLPRDGSKQRVRDHAGYLAQQVKGLMDKLGLDFGMYQDHLVDGGCDVKTLAYEQTIPFLSKSIDVAFTRIEEIERRLHDIDGK